MGAPFRLGSLPDEVALAQIGEKCLSSLGDRRGVGDELEVVMRTDQDTWREICVEVGTLAWDAVLQVFES